MYKPQYEKFVNFLNLLLIFAFLLALISLIGDYGFYLSPEVKNLFHRLNIFIVWYFVIQAILKLFFAIHPWEYFKSRWFEYVLVFLIISETAIIINLTGIDLFGRFLQGNQVKQITLIYIVAFQIPIIIALLNQVVHLNEKIAGLRLHPSQILLGSFLIIILIGTFLLLLPKSVAPGKHLSFVDALFTATSATCVTGLIVVDTGTHFSLQGQLIILTLIQIGGLGLMTFSTFFAFVLRRSISLREKTMLREIMNYEQMGMIGKLLTSTVIFTFLLELIGSIFLFLGMAPAEGNLTHRIYSAIFHSISAFCNAGFSLYSTSFMNFQNNYTVLFTLMGLIVLGGLGFPVLLNLSRFRQRRPGFHSFQLTVQTRLVLWMTISLIVLGTAFFYFLEWNNTLQPLTGFQKIVHSLFQSITARTAGFNTLNIGAVTTPMVLIFLLLMFIGASPGSTGGGIKTTTFAILTAGVFTVIKGRDRIDMFKKTIPYTVLNRALVIILFSLIFIFSILFIMVLTQPFSFTDILFEVFSAFGTVGLSRGITPHLTTIGKIAIVVCMFFGRLGALTISLAITGPTHKYHYDYPKENVMVG